MTYIIQQAIANRITLWDREAAGYFCRLARRGADFQNVVYPTGLKTVKAVLGAEVAEVKLPVAKQLRAAGFKVMS